MICFDTDPSVAPGWPEWTRWWLEECASPQFNNVKLAEREGFEHPPRPLRGPLMTVKIAGIKPLSWCNVPSCLFVTASA
jgi:hypothetical protein